MSNVAASRMLNANRRKAKTGCAHCKARRVKCDEVRPACKACQRRGLVCEYRAPFPGFVLKSESDVPSTTTSTVDNNYRQSEASEARPTSYDIVDNQSARPEHHLLELRLWHRFTSTTHLTFATTTDIWRTTIPELAFASEFLLDAILAIAALDISKHDSHDAQALIASKTYFDRAIKAHRQAVNNITHENIEALVLTTLIISLNALVLLGETDNDTRDELMQYLLWLRLAQALRTIHDHGYDWPEIKRLHQAAAVEMPTILNEFMLNFADRQPFESLLTWNAESEAISLEDKETYEQTTGYIGSIFKAIKLKQEDPFAICLRFIILPIYCPARFIDLVEQQRPRALVILAHALAMMKMIERDVFWFKNIAKRQVGAINSRLPPGWEEMMEWPLQIATSLVA